MKWNAVRPDDGPNGYYKWVHFAKLHLEMPKNGTPRSKAMSNVPVEKKISHFASQTLNAKAHLSSQLGGTDHDPVHDTRIKLGCTAKGVTRTPLSCEAYAQRRLRQGTNEVCRRLQINWLQRSFNHASLTSSTEPWLWPTNCS